MRYRIANREALEAWLEERKSHTVEGLWGPPKPDMAFALEHPEGFKDLDTGESMYIEWVKVHT